MWSCCHKPCHLHRSPQTIHFALPEPLPISCCVRKIQRQWLQDLTQGENTVVQRVCQIWFMYTYKSSLQTKLSLAAHSKFCASSPALQRNTWRNSIRLRARRIAANCMADDKIGSVAICENTTTNQNSWQPTGFGNMANKSIGWLMQTVPTIKRCLQQTNNLGHGLTKNTDSKFCWSTKNKPEISQSTKKWTINFSINKKYIFPKINFLNQQKMVSFFCWSTKKCGQFLLINKCYLYMYIYRGKCCPNFAD